MKILMVSQYYWPENSRVTDIAETLVKFGNDVTVLTGLPNYPQGYIFDGYKNKSNWNQVQNGVKIIRVKLFPRKTDLFSRFLNYYSFPYYACKKVKELDKDFDVVLAMEESPILLVKPAIKYAKLNKVKCVMYEMDLWPESLLAGGYSNKSLIYKYYRKVSAKLYSKFDSILVSSEAHISYIKNLPYCKNLNIKYLPQYAESIFEDNEYQTINNGKIDILFAGNIGKAQSIDTVIKAARLLKDEKDYVFHIVGDGSKLNEAKELAESFKLDNMIFYGSKKLKEMKDYFDLADILLISLEDKSYANMTLPGKLQSYLAVGKPIIGSISGSTQTIINENELGYCVDAEDSLALAYKITQFKKADLNQMGKNARQYYVNNFTNKHFFDSLIKELEINSNK